jgi:mRNA-degrading endonuclease RelE of RelBE toxin-antitoxin system
VNYLDLKPWTVEFKPGWDKYFKKFDKSIQQQILKKLKQMEQPLSARGLQTSRYQVEEISQYRIAFIQDNNTGTKYIHFVGNHKQYEKWYKNQ